MFFFRGKTKREKVEWAYGLWLNTPRTTSMTKFVNNMTGIPQDEVWKILLGKSN